VHSAILQPESARTRRRLRVEPPIDDERLRYAPRSCQTLDAANQDRGRPIARSDDKVEHLVHAIAEVDIPETTARIHHLGSRRASDARVAREVALAVISLDLGDEPRLHPPAPPPHEEFPEQPAGERHGFFRAQLFRFDYATHPA